MDAAHQWTDEQLEGLERLLRAEYTQAAKEARSTLESMLKTYEREREQRLKALDNTSEAREAFDQWCRGQALQQARVASIAEQMSEAAVSANGKALAAVRDMMPMVYSENANRAAFDIDKMLGANTMFDLVDESTVREIMLSGASNSPIIREVPNPVHDRPKDYRWNRQKFTSAITQGILQGESIPNIVKRTSDIFGSNEAAAVRAARTATTGAENAGRISSYRRATDDLGIPMVEEWVATLDMRTRESHRALDGVQVEVGEAFHAEDGDLRYPGDPQGPASEVYNCRCTIRGRIKGFENAHTERWSRLPDGMTYEEWKAAKPETREESYRNMASVVSPQWMEAAPSAAGGASGVVQGTDLLETWHRRADQFDFEIEDVINAQGFDGLPRVVSADEFDAAVRAANGGEGIIMQRIYSAPDQSALNSYRDSLYGGNWYVDCSKGGSAHGQGMYTVSEKGFEVTSAIEGQMRHYQQLYERNGFGSLYYVETMTLDPSANITTKSKLCGEYARMLESQGRGDYSDLLYTLADNEGKRYIGEDVLDLGAYAAARGYDAYSLRDPDSGATYTVVLNRTKLIIKGSE